jgi:hypothetical protein
VDVPVSETRAFYFAPTGAGPGRGARTLRQFVTTLEGSSVGNLESYLLRNDFSRWIQTVFGDYALASEVRTLEQRHRVSPRADTLPEILNVIRARYDLGDQAPVELAT